MEPENKKEIRIGWLKFAGMQLVVVLIVCLCFYAAYLYPKKLKADYIKINNENLTYVYTKYIKPATELKKQIDALSDLTSKIKNGQFGPSENQELVNQTVAVEKWFESNKTRMDSILILYVRCLNNYAVEYKKVTDCGTCPTDLAAKRKEFDDLQAKFNSLDRDFTSLKRLSGN